MPERKGSIAVNTQDIFPIIKKWLYSEHDIFIRELIANATDAITKRSTMARVKNQEIPKGKITVSVNKENKTITITDNGLGMSETDIEKYLAQLAFSGAEEFIDKMKEENLSGGEIIGKFGLGFYSSFMVSNKVVVESLSMVEGSTPAKWSCEGNPEYTFEKSSKEDVGTKITLHVNDESHEFLDKYKLVDSLKNFCDFMPHQILVSDELETTKTTKDKDGNDVEEVIEPILINDTEPLWKKDPKEISDDEYKTFFRKLFPMEPEPLFWLHLNVDHPFNLQGILYFPKINPTKPVNERDIKFYAKQVFVSDNVKHIIPDFFGMLKGVIDSSDIPLNVSRSSLQGDPNITKISNYVVKKVAESLKVLFKNERERFEAIWPDISLFVKYGAISDTKFDEIMRERILFENSSGKLVTMNEYSASIPENYKEKLKVKIVYFEKLKSDRSLKAQLKEIGIETVITDDHIDPHFMNHVEFKKLGDLEVKFAAIDTEFENILGTENSTPEDIKVKDLFVSTLVNEENKSLLDIDIRKMASTTAPAYLKIDEQSKRFQQMSQSMGQNTPFPLKKTLVLNPAHALIQNTFKLSQKDENKQLVDQLCHYVEDLAHISGEGLNEDEKEGFVQRSQDLLLDLTSSIS